MFRVAMWSLNIKAPNRTGYTNSLRSDNSASRDVVKALAYHLTHFGGYLLDLQLLL